MASSDFLFDLNKSAPFVEEEELENEADGETEEELRSNLSERKLVAGAQLKLS